MQLEKATSSNSEAGLAGWISSNDVTLFTMVLVVIIALFLHANLIKGQDENEQLTDENELLSEDLTSADRQLDATLKERDQLQLLLSERDRQFLQTQSQLTLTQQDRDKLHVDLLDSLQRIESLNKSIAALSTEKSALESKQVDLTARKAALEKDKATLTTQSATLSAEKASLNERLSAVAAQLENRVTLLEELEKQRDRLNEQADALEEIVATLNTKLKAADLDMEKLQAAARQQHGKSIARIRELTDEAKSENARAEDYLARLRRAAELFRGLQADKKNLQSEVVGLSQQLGNAQTRFQQQLAQETRVNRELVALNGKLLRVAILFDASGSMKQQGIGSEDRWAEAQTIAATWLAHLDVDECVLIVFSSEVNTFPDDGTMVKIRGADGENNRAKLLNQLKSVEPSGWTNTLAALQKAYNYKDIDTILLFSDGTPTNPGSGEFDAEVAKQIYTLCQQNPGVPVNTIGLGNYFDQTTSSFLRNVARITGGTFRGR